MELDTTLQIITFSIFAIIAVGGALGMATTMSMFRSGIFLMSSFIGVAGLFILLSADLIGMLQVMMYTGGMLVMILFMLLFSSDPGGEMMSSMMELGPIARFFSKGLAREHHAQQGGHEGHEDMSMTTPIKKPAAFVGSLAGLLLLGLVLLRPAWPLSQESPDPRSAERIGDLLMGKYMMAFEGAGLLILLGIFGAVYIARPSGEGAIDKGPPLRDLVSTSAPTPSRETLRAAMDEPPAALEDEDES